MKKTLVLLVVISFFVFSGCATTKSSYFASKAELQRLRGEIQSGFTDQDRIIGMMEDDILQMQKEIKKLKERMKKR